MEYSILRYFISNTPKTNLTRSHRNGRQSSTTLGGCGEPAPRSDRGSTAVRCWAAAGLAGGGRGQEYLCDGRKHKDKALTRERPEEHKLAGANSGVRQRAPCAT